MHGTLDLAESARPAESARRECALQDCVLQDRAREHALSLPLEDFDHGHPELFHSDTHWPYFDRLRKADPLHHAKECLNTAPRKDVFDGIGQARSAKSRSAKSRSAKSRSIAPRSDAPGIN